MLTKRTNILFSQKTWQALTKLAKKREMSAAELIRQAVASSYFSQNRERSVAAAYDSVLRSRQPVAGAIDYKKLINDGRQL